MCVSARRQPSLEDRAAPVWSELLGQTQNCDGAIHMPKREFSESGERPACYVAGVTARCCISHRCANLDAVDYLVWQPCLSP